jgi:NAD-dependent DNA ligase
VAGEATVSAAPAASRTTAAHRVAWLRREIRRHDRLYYEQARPESSDAAYDRLKQELIELETRHSELATATSPTRRPGGRRTVAFAPVVHKVAMLSLESVTTTDAVLAWERRVRAALGHAPRGWVLRAQGRRRRHRPPLRTTNVAGYSLRADQVRGLPGFGARAAENLIATITASRDRGLARLVHALGIRLVGAHVARLLAERFGRLDRLIRADAAELATVQGIGPTIAESVVKFFAEPANRDVCRRLIAAGVRSTHRAAPHGAGPLAGKTFVRHSTRARSSRCCGESWRR